MDNYNYLAFSRIYWSRFHCSNKIKGARAQKIGLKNTYLKI